MVLNRYCS